MANRSEDNNEYPSGTPIIAQFIQTVKSDWLKSDKSVTQKLLLRIPMFTGRTTAGTLRVGMGKMPIWRAVYLPYSLVQEEL